MKNILLLSVFLFVYTFSLANNNPAFEIKFKSGKFIPEVTTDFGKVMEPISEEKNQEYIYRLIQFYTIPTNAEKQRINGMGIELMSYIPNKAFFARIPKTISNNDLTDLNIRSMLILEEHFKVSPQLTKKELPAWAMSGNDIQLNVKYYSKTDEANLIKFITKNKGKVIGRLEKVNILVIQYSATAINDLAKNPLIQWIEPISPPSTPDSTVGKASTRSNALNTSYSTGRKYDGSGVVVALSDDGVIGPHIDMEGRVTMHTNLNTGNHGDMTSGIFAGAGNLDPSIGGMAPASDIHIFKQGNFIFLSSYEHIINGVDNMNNLGIVVTSTSYSQNQGGIYNASTEFTDQQVNENQNMIHVLSAGNSGTFDHGYGAGAGWANISGGIKAGKNVICAGNVNQYDALLTSSSRGPAADGRIKPDLCAQGDGHLSTDENNTYQVGGGTSASTPAIAGVVTQLYQAYKEHNGGLEPETGLLKASLMNTAEDLGNPGPDFKHGWGRINGLKAVRIIEEDRYIRDSIEQGNIKNHMITVPSNVSEVRIMTYWMDVEGNPASAIALVNDINMQVLVPGGVDFLNPWVLDPTPSAANLNTDAIEGIDNLNNVEQVVIDNPVAGDYTVNINGFAIPEGPQRYYVVYDFIYDDVELTYPIGGEGLAPGETEFIRWDASVGSENFTLEYSTDGGVTFNNISNTISSTSRTYSWTVPNVLSNNVKLKVSRGVSNSESDTTLTIVGVPANLNIVKVCPDTIELAWDNVSGVSMYEISMLGQKYMDSIGVSTTNSFIVTGLNPNEEHWFSVRSIVSESQGRRAIAINQPAGTDNCGFNNDVELVEFLYPLEGATPTCKDLENTDIRINLTNVGVLVTTDIELNYQVNTEPVVTEILTSSLSPGEIIDYTFATQADLSGIGNYEIAVWASWPADQNYYNDTILIVTEVLNSNLINSFPHVENFQTFIDCSTAYECEQISCALENGWINFENLVADDIDWRTDTDGTGTANTGPTTDYDNGTSTGKYLYLEGTQGCNFKEATLLSPCIDLTTADCANFEFAYHMYGVNIGELHVDVVTDHEEFLDVVSPKIGNQGNSWKLLDIDLTPFLGEIINVKIRGSIGNGVRADMAIDAMTFEVLNSPVAGFDFTTGASGDEIIFTNSWTGNSATYSWDFGDGNLSSELNPSNMYQNIGTYDVTLIISNDCGSDTITQQVDVLSTATSDLQEMASRIEIYPNPTNDNFTIDFPPYLSTQNVNIKLIDVLGKSSINIEHKKNTGKLSIDISDIASGVYFISIAGEEFGIIRKIIKH